MKKKYTCFVISPIGPDGSEIRKDYDDLFDYIITPALETYDMEVKRGDHFITDDRIGDSVIRNIQNADICICDISLPNVNVYYELGRRDETQKPVLLIKRKGGTANAVDIADRRYYEYDWDSRNSIPNAIKAIREFVEPLIDSGTLGESNNKVSLANIADTVSRLERKIDRLITPGTPVGTRSSQPINDIGGDPTDAFRVAILQRDIPAAERAMFQLQPRMDWIRFYDLIVEQVAGMGSQPAGEMLIEKAQEFFDETSVTYSQKVDYIGYLVSYANKRDAEKEVEDLVVSLCSHLIEIQDEADEKESIAQPYNQLNRLYHGIYATTGETEYLDKAIASLQRGLSIIHVNFLYYNLSMCLFSRSKDTESIDDLIDAKEAISQCLLLDKKAGKDDSDHLELAYKIFHTIDDPEAESIWEQLNQIDPTKAFLAKRTV